MPLSLADPLPHVRVDTPLSVSVPHQVGNWCWAAAAVGVANCYEPEERWDQCRVAARVFGVLNCCQDGNPLSQYNITKNMDLALGATHNYKDTADLKMQHIDTQNASEKVVEEFNARAPTVLRFAGEQSGVVDPVGHAVVVTNMGATGDAPEGKFFLIQDPIKEDPVRQQVQWFPLRPSDKRWTHSYFTKPP